MASFETRWRLQIQSNSELNYEYCRFRNVCFTINLQAQSLSQNNKGKHYDDCDGSQYHKTCLTAGPFFVMLMTLVKQQWLQEKSSTLLYLTESEVVYVLAIRWSSYLDSPSILTRLWS